MQEVNMNTNKTLRTDHRLLLAFYQDEQSAEQVLQHLLKAEIPMERISVLGQASASGDDPLGIYYPKLGDRMAGWGKMGALWGGLWGLLTGALGMFLIPGVGPMIAAGPIAEALIGAAGGAGIGGGVLAGAGAVSQLGVAVHRMGVPAEKIEQYHERLEQGEYLVMLIVDAEETERWREKLSQTQPDLVTDYPYVGYTDAIRAAV
jgi:uncharacterized membrane protein